MAAIERHVPKDRSAFERNELLQGWFVMNLQIIGEAARALPAEVRDLAPDVEWSKIIGMRNVLVHGYFNIDTEIVWNAVELDIPTLKASIERLLNDIRDD